MSFKLKKQLEPQLSKISEMSFDESRLSYLNEDVAQTNLGLDQLIRRESKDDNNNQDQNETKSASHSDTSLYRTNLYLPAERHRGSLCEPINPMILERESKKLSLPLLNVPGMFRGGSRSSLSSTGSEKFDGLPPHFKEMFHNLDEKDGNPDGEICKETLKNIFRTLETPSDLSLNLRTSNRSLEFTNQISLVDTDKNGCLSHDEFADLIIKVEENPDLDHKERFVDNLEKGAYAEVCHTCPPPLFMIIVSILQFVFFIYHASLHHESNTWNRNAPLCSNLIFNPGRREEVWRYLTYSLVHSGISHILLNVFIQLVVGLVLEMSHGSWRVSLLYLIGVISGSLTSSCTEPLVHLAGASSGVYALIAAHLSNLILNWEEDELIITPNNRGGRVINGGLIRLLKLTALLAFMVVDITIAVYDNYFTGRKSTTSYGAHVAGAVIGLLAGILILKNRKVKTWELWLQLGCYLLLGIFFLSTVLWNVLGNRVYRIFNEEEDFFPQFDECS